MVGLLMAILPYLPYFRFLALPHGLEEAPVVHQPGPDHVGEGGLLDGWLSHGHYALPTKFQFRKASPRPITV